MSTLLLKLQLQILQVKVIPQAEHCREHYHTGNKFNRRWPRPQVI
ncbi:hypothetical protein AB691_0626 [Stutzerimonas stutzeri]|nr:hypothetical protein AB691_0626 [Stutzerimonas stutzeri]